MKRARAAGISSWEAVDALSDDELDRKLYPEPASPSAKPRSKPDPAQIHIELRRHGVTLRLLHEEYLQAQPDGYGYTPHANSARTTGVASAMRQHGRSLGRMT